LRATDVIDAGHPDIQRRARELADDTDKLQTARRCFEWVRDEIRHSGDCQASVTTCWARPLSRTRWRGKSVAPCSAGRDEFNEGLCVTE
jgi:hypothetical protein